MPESLSSLFEEFPFPTSGNIPDPVLVSGVTADSRKVEPGNLFVACKGENFDGHQFISQAIRQGAAAVVGSSGDVQIQVPYIRVENPRQSLAHLAAAFHHYPGRELTVIGVTGTDGKTTTSNILYNVLKTAGMKTGIISTVNAVIGDEILDTGLHVTTPDAPDVQKYLSKMVQAGLTHVVLETTSHGWAQYRVDACEFDIGVVTNITHEHLDQHGSYENYRAAKARLFTSLAETHRKAHGNIGLGVINADDQSYEYLMEVIPVRCDSYGLSPKADVRAKSVNYDPSGIEFIAIGENWEVQIKSGLVGSFNVSNCLAAITVAVCGLGMEPAIVAEGISNFEGIPGRMERIDYGQSFACIVDFAHTPNALENAIATVRQVANGRVITVFGSAGLRDREKRRMMAQVSAGYSDLSILTAEDPRTESLDDILSDMALGAESRGGVEGKTYWRIPDRGEAIRFALSLAKPGDVVIACGKGHEQSMCFGQIEYPWDDRTAMKAALSEYMGIDGPEMPYLPTQDD